MDTSLLIVASDLLLNKVIADILGRIPCTPFYCMDAEEAGRIYVRERPGLVLLELGILQRNGPKLIDFFRRHHKSRIILVPSADDRNILKVTQEFGADGCLPIRYDIFRTNE